MGHLDTESTNLGLLGSCLIPIIEVHTSTSTAWRGISTIDLGNIMGVVRCTVMRLVSDKEAIDRGLPLPECLTQVIDW
jgi:hypothetical protein